jgi:ABC-type cobalamin/Fe3+-siderophores transport system ATPase subunit
MQGINMRFMPGTLTMIVGAVGSGKSSLLAALFQQISCLQGCVKVPPCHLTLASFMLRVIVFMCAVAAMLQCLGFIF